MALPSEARRSHGATVVVTGASGFIGTALVPELRRLGYTVIEASRSRLPNNDYRHLPPIDGSILVHLAEPRDLQIAEAAGEVHFDRVTGVCRALIDRPWRHVIYASSSVVYGYTSHLLHVPAEDVAPAHIYARTKLACEKMVLDVGGTVIRLANVYGPGMAANNVVSHILEQIPGTTPLALQATTPVRDFLWIDDTAAGLAAAVERESGGILNMGSGVSVPVGQLAGLTLRIAGEGHRRVVATRPQGPLSQLYLDISETVGALSWMPRVSLDDGLRMLLDHHLQ